jgi:peptide methionine sulfoxide reductase MsrA
MTKLFKLSVIAFIVILFMGCTPTIRKAPDKGSNGYNAIYVIDDKLFTSAERMKSFVEDFKASDDIVIEISKFQYVILRK